jgi:hypothetical protein
MTDVICQQTIELLLASIYRKAADGRIHKFLYGRPGGPQHQKNVRVELQYSRHGLLDSALFVRKHGPKHIGALPIGEIESRLMHFISENFWYLAQETFGAKFDCSFGEHVSPRVRAQLTAAIAASEIFNARDVLTVYPLVPVRVLADFDTGVFFLIAPASLAKKLPSGIPKEAADGEHFPPLMGEGGIKHLPTSWLGVRVPTLHAARKIKATVLGALALTPHRFERYLFTGRPMFGGQCTIDDGWSYGFAEAHTPALSEDIIIDAEDHPWLAVLATKLRSDADRDRSHTKALEYYYRAWAPDEVARFPVLFMALDAIFGDVGRATQAVIDAVGPIMGPDYSYKRLKQLLSLRAAVIHGGAPDVCESDNYHRYYVDYGEDPIRDLELIVARCMQSVIFQGLQKERPHTHTNLIKEKTGRIIT